MMSSSHKSKKGSIVVESLTILVVLTVSAILGVYAASVFNETNDDIQADADMHDTAKANVQSLNTTFPVLMDDLFLFLFVLIVIFVLASVFFIDSYPIFFIIAIMLFIGALIVALVMGNAYNEIMQDSTISATANSMPYMGWIMRHILETVLAVGFATAIALFAKIKMIG